MKNCTRCGDQIELPANAAGECFLCMESMEIRYFNIGWIKRDQIQKFADFALDKGITIKILPRKESLAQINIEATDEQYFLMSEFYTDNR